MTRKEQIEEAVFEFGCKTADDSGADNWSFKEGARWADKNPDRAIRAAYENFEATAKYCERLQKAVSEAKELLEDAQLGHEHAPGLKHTREMGDNYGWCDFCSTKVTWGPDPIKDWLSRHGGGE